MAHILWVIQYDSYWLKNEIGRPLTSSLVFNTSEIGTVRSVDRILFDPVRVSVRGPQCRSVVKWSDPWSETLLLISTNLFGPVRDPKIWSAIGSWIVRGPNFSSYKPIGHFYVDIKTPSLHGNNSEFGAKIVNIKMFWGLMVDNRAHTFILRVFPKHIFSRIVWWMCLWWCKQSGAKWPSHH